MEVKSNDSEIPLLRPAGINMLVAKRCIAGLHISLYQVPVWLSRLAWGVSGAGNQGWANFGTIVWLSVGAGGESLGGCDREEGTCGTWDICGCSTRGTSGAGCISLLLSLTMQWTHFKHQPERESHEVKSMTNYQHIYCASIKSLNSSLRRKSKIYILCDGPHSECLYRKIKN